MFLNAKNVVSTVLKGKLFYKHRRLYETEKLIYYIMDKYESKSKKITYKSYEDFIEQFNQLEIAWDMPIAIRDDEVDWTTTYLKAKRVYYYVRI